MTTQDQAAAPPATATTPRLELRHVYKSFGGVQVLRDVDFWLHPGEVVGLAG